MTFQKGNKLGRPFQPGNRANPGGRPRSLVEAVKVHASPDKLMRALALIAWGSVEERRAFFGEAMRIGARDRLEAINTLADRGWGKVAQSVALTGEGGGPIRAIQVLPPVDSLVEVAVQALPPAPDLPESE